VRQHTLITHTLTHPHTRSHAHTRSHTHTLTHTFPLAHIPSAYPVGLLLLAVLNGLATSRKHDVLHVKIQNTGDYYDLYGGEKFANLSELISYYTQEQHTLKEKNGEDIELREPLLCEDPTSERWFHGNLASRDAEQALMQRGQDGSYLVRTSASQPGRYVLTVRVKSDVTHIMIRAARGVYDLGGGQQFNNLTSLIEHYKKHPIIEAGGRVVKLLAPFNATRLTLSGIKGRFEELSKV